MYIGIDQSYTKTGVCAVKKSQLIFFTSITSDPDKDIFDRSVEITDRLITIINKEIPFLPQGIAIEGLAFGMRGNATRDLAGLQFTIINAFRQNEGTLNPQIISPLSLKKFATGSGKSKKEDMIKALPIDVHKEFTSAGYKKTTGLADMADAFWLAKYIEHKYNYNVD